MPGYRSPQTELAQMPLCASLCEVSGDLEDIGEEDAGLVWEI